VRPTTVELAAGRLRVVFAKRGDRFAHTLVRQWIDGDVRTLAESVEGAEDDPCPPSPALQMVEREERGASGPVLLGLGMAGACHWSLSVSQVGPERLRFDVACRAERGAALARATYRQVDVSASIGFAPLGTAEISSTRAPPSIADGEPGGQASPQTVGWEIRAAPVDFSTDAAVAATIRWQYDAYLETT
jgi:hypothetical protein